MLGKHKLEVRVRRDIPETPETTEPTFTPENLTRLAKKVILYGAVGALGSYAAATIINTASDIAVHKYASDRKEDD